MWALARLPRRLTSRQVRGGLLPCAHAAAARHLAAVAVAAPTAAPHEAYAAAAAVLDGVTNVRTGGGGGDDAERQRAIVAITAAAAAGHPAAMGRVARWRLFGLCGMPKDAHAAARGLQAAALAGDATAAFWLGMLFMNGADGLPGGVALAPPSTTSPSATGTPTGSEAPPAAAVDPAAGRAVLAEIRRQRKVALANKARKVQGLPPLPLTPATAPTASASEADVLAAPLPASLQRDERRAYAWLLRAASDDHADAQVCRGEGGGGCRHTLPAGGGRRWRSGIC
jgi:TPR repeat protein